jgi:putative FmdB family regulatory protein
MPSYDYKCSECEEKYVFNHKMVDDPVTKCPNCREDSLKIVISSSPVLVYSSKGYNRRLGK